MQTKLEPIGDRIIIKVVEAESVTAGGLIIPENAKEKPREGTVVSVGPGRVLENGERLPMQLKEGDQILFGKFAGTEVTVDGESLRMLKEEDVFAKITRA